MLLRARGGAMNGLTLFVISVLFFSFPIQGLAQTPKQTSPEIRQKTFEAVWKTVNANYYDPHFGGVDWTAIKKNYEPQLATVQNDIELQDLLDRMLREIKISHLHLLDVAKLDQQLGRSVVTRGLALRDLDHQVVVTRRIDG